MHLFTRNLNMLLVLKFKRLLMNYHRFFGKNAFLQKMKKMKKKDLKKVFDMYLYKNRFKLGKICYQNDQCIKLYKL